MATSKRYDELSQRIMQLRRRFLPVFFSSTGEYSDLDQDFAKAFRLLVHAEIESYLEERAAAIAKTSLQKWITEEKANKVILFLLAYADVHWEAPPDSVRKLQNDSQMINQKINKAVSVYQLKLRNNHGVKEKNILQILCPIGIRYEELDVDWLRDMDNYGGKRGLVAHSSSRIIPNIDIKSEFNEVLNILDELKNVDEFLNYLERGL